jgi:hypothetical protein
VPGSSLPLSFVRIALGGVFPYFLVITMFWDPLGSHHEKAIYYCKMMVAGLDYPPWSGRSGIGRRDAHILALAEHSVII